MARQGWGQQLPLSLDVSVLCTAGQLWHFSATTAGTSAKGSAGDRGAGAEQTFLVCQEQGKEMLVVVASQLSNHHMRWNKVLRSPNAAEGLTQLFPFGGTWLQAHGF